MSTEVKIVFQPSGRNVYALPGTTLLEAAARAGIVLRTACGGAGSCGKCLVRVHAGECAVSDVETGVLGAERVAAGYRLACRAKVDGALTVEVPESSLFESETRILTADSGGKRPAAPVVRKIFRRLAPSGRGDAVADLERLTSGLPARKTRLELMRAIPALLRSSGFAVTMAYDRRGVVAVEPGDTSGSCYGVAFDIGSTTLVGTLTDLKTGRELAVAAGMNPQTSYGDDVLARIRYCRETPGGTLRLRDTLLEALENLVGKLLAGGRVAAREHIYRAAFAGNTTMQQLACGIDPSALGEMPFSPAFSRAFETDAAAIGLRLAPGASVFVFPQIGGFVGGDTVAGILATGLADRENPALLVDIGTNGEIVLSHGGRLTATSVAAGPAFEGARIANGMRAAAGAIEKVVAERDGDLAINVIGDRPAAGICGSGLIDAAAELLRRGVMDFTGRIVDPAELPAGISPALSARVLEAPAGLGGRAVALAHAGQTASGRPLCLYQKDIRELQLANAAIRAGINLLLREAGLRPCDLGEILLAGAFGNFVRRGNALRIGMLPPLPHRSIRFVGNVASMGAKMALLSDRAKAEAEAIRRKTRHLDLSMNPDFQPEFGEAMLFPESGDSV